MVRSNTYFEDYLKNKFDKPIDGHKLPLKSELFVDTWMEYFHETNSYPVFEVLKEKLVQFNFPIKSGISQTEVYKNATLKGAQSNLPVNSAGLVLNRPEALKLSFLDGPVGKLPLLSVEDDFDFANIIRALAHKNEPILIPKTMGASLIRGINNWDRICKLKNGWQGENRLENWASEFKKNVLPNKNLYQDTIIVLSKKNYSGINNEAVNLDKNDWLEKSFLIRKYHEYAHYFTLRYYGCMSNNIYDEILADYLGISMAFGVYDESLFLKFMGLENYPMYRKGSRFENYINLKELSSKEFHTLTELCFKASKNIARFDKFLGQTFDLKERIKRLSILCTQGLGNLANENSFEEIIESYSEVYKTDNFNCKYV